MAENTLLEKLGLDGSSFFSGIKKAGGLINDFKGKIQSLDDFIRRSGKSIALKPIVTMNEWSKTYGELKEDVEWLKALKVDPDISFSQFKTEVNEVLGSNVKKIKKRLSDNIRYKIDTNPAVKAVRGLGQKTGKMVERLKKAGYLKIAPALALKDMATKKITGVASKFKALGGKVLSPMVKVKDNFKAVAGKFKGVMQSLGKIASGAAGLITKGLSGIGQAVGAGMKMEKQKMSIEHFVGAYNRGKSQKEVKAMSDDYLKHLRENADKTAFSEEEVMTAGAMSLKAAKGNTKEAKALLKLAENMAALNPGKSLQDAMKAVSDLKSGKTSSLQEFGVDIKQKDIQSNGMDSVVKQINERFKGGTDKLGATGAGQWDIITGQIQSLKTDVGLKVLEGLKPVLEKVVTWLNNNKDKITEFVGSIGTGFSNFIGFIESQMPVINAVAGFIGELIGGIKEAVGWFGRWWNSGNETVTGLKSSFADLQSKFGGVIESIKGLVTGFTVFWGNHGEEIMAVWGNAWGFIMTTVGGVLDLISGVFTIFGDILRGDWDKLWEDVKNMFVKHWENIMKIFEAGREWIASVFDLFTGDSKDNNAGKNNTASTSPATHTKQSSKAVSAILPKSHTITSSPFHSAQTGSLLNQAYKYTTSKKQANINMGGIKPEIKLYGVPQNQDYNQITNQVFESIMKAVRKANDNMGTEVLASG